MGLKDLFGKQEESAVKPANIEIGSPVSGKVIPLTEVKDEAFARGILGNGAAIEPTEGVIVAPIDATVSNSGLIKHAVALKNEFGVEILIHIGLETVKLHGEHFERFVQTDQVVKKGDVLVKFDLEKLKELGYDMTTPVVISGLGSYTKFVNAETQVVKANDTIMTLS